MDRKSFTFFVGLAVVTISSLIPITALNNDAPQSEKPPADLERSKQAPAAKDDQQGSKRPTSPTATSAIKPETPVPKTPSAESEAQRQWKLWKNRLRRAFAPAYWLFNWVLAAFGVVGVFVGIGTLLAIQREVDATTTAAKAAADGVIEAQKSRGIARNAAISAKFSARAAENTLATNQEIERAYIRMSYRDLLFLERKHMTSVRPKAHDENPDTVDLVIELRNVGRTPGTIAGGWCGFLYQPACDKPKRCLQFDSSTKLTRLFMLPDQMIDFAIQKPMTTAKVLFLRNGEPESGATVIEGKKLPVTEPKYLWLVGEIYYLDRFKRRHKAGYATRWDRLANRFVYDPSVGDLNYDAPPTEAEIKSWYYES